LWRQRTGRYATNAQRPDDGLHAAIWPFSRGDLSRVLQRWGGRRAYASERPDAGRSSDDPAGGVLGERRGRRQSTQLPDPAPEFHAGTEVSGAHADPRRTAGLLGARVDVSLERAGVRRRRVRGG